MVEVNRFGGNLHSVPLKSKFAWCLLDYHKSRVRCLNTGNVGGVMESYTRMGYIGPTHTFISTLPVSRSYLDSVRADQHECYIRSSVLARMHAILPCCSSSVYIYYLIIVHVSIKKIEWNCYLNILGKITANFKTP